MPADLVSVVIPCFNAAAHVGAAIGSALDQRLPEIDVEVIAVDDASTDGTRDTLAAIAAKNGDAVRVVGLPRNGGPAAARNAGLRQARGAFVCFLDADDRYAPLSFARCVPLLRRRANLAAVITGVELVDCPRAVHPLQHEAIVTSLPSNVIVRREVAELIGGFPEDPAFRGRSAGEDVQFKFALIEAFEVAVLADPCLRYSARTSSHLHYFLDRSEVVDGQLVVRDQAPESASGALAAARERYREAARRQIDGVPRDAPIRTCLKRPRR